MKEDLLKKILSELQRQSDRLEKIERKLDPAASLSVKQEAAMIRAQGKSIRQHLKQRG